ncbi:phytanoyl-CoA dioxygenase family protein [Streptomyces sp. NPDC051985]|uniref:phytanoyl-CoA dioxygenase family protein n=1 Tax=Streptomyces sp. NPDC051985 TaxID=3155807 RepID=UPI00343D9D42
MDTNVKGRMLEQISSEGALDVEAIRAAGSPVTVRDLTDDECAFYWEHGWVSLPQLISEESAGILLAEAQRMQAQAEALAAPAYQAKTRTIWGAPALTNPVFASVCCSVELGTAAARLMSSPIFGPRQARRSYDALQLKGPASDGGTRTPWHQDFPAFPLDRAGMMVFWIALVPLTPDMGTLRFVDHSNKMGVLGNFNEFDGEDLVDRYPGILDQGEVVGGLSLRPGDATAHDTMTVHSAPANTSDRGRWVYSPSYFPADAQYTGAPHPRFGNIDLPVNEPIDHPLFPVIGDFPAAK